MRPDSSRRLLLKLVGLAALALAGCGRAGSDVAELSERAITAVPGVTDAQLRSGIGAMFKSFLAGTITLEASSRTDALSVYDDALREIALVLRDEDDSDSRVVGGVEAQTSQGDVLTARDLGIIEADERLDSVQAHHLFQRYDV